MSGLITALLGGASALGDMGKEEMEEKRKIDAETRAMARATAVEALKRQYQRDNIEYSDQLARQRNQDSQAAQMQEWDRRNSIQQGQMNSMVTDAEGNAYRMSNSGRLDPMMVEGGKGYEDEANALEDPEFGLEAAYGKDESILDLIQDEEVPFRPRQKPGETPQYLKSLMNTYEKQIEELASARVDASPEDRKVIDQRIAEIQARIVQMGTGKDPYAGLDMSGLDGLGGETEAEAGGGGKPPPLRPDADDAGGDLRERLGLPVDRGDRPEGMSMRDYLQGQVDRPKITAEMAMEEAELMFDPDQTTLEEAEAWFASIKDSLGVWDRQKLQDKLGRMRAIIFKRNKQE